LIIITVIFAVFFFLQINPSFLKVKANFSSSNLSSAGSLIEETAVNLEQAMGGPINFNDSLIPTAQANVDLSADDDMENQDAFFTQDSSIVSLNNPEGNDIFSGLRREALDYVVQDGDTPFDIAIKFGINTDTILWANNLRDGDIIKPGQKLLILPINGIRVKVGSRDTLAALAKKYSGKAEEIIAFNYLPTDGSLTVGGYLVIPNGEIAVAIAPKVSAPKYAQNASSGGLMIPTTGYNWGRVHGLNGIDIANHCGTPIYASSAGTVEIADGAGWNWGYGKYIQIQHSEGIETLYGHLSAIYVDVGQGVSKGQLIGLMGTTGRSTGCHLHFEVHGARNPLRK
jgi:murein DD-endopeptidase MepM/ murein hydrolase activator NlpD